MKNQVETSNTGAKRRSSTVRVVPAAAIRRRQGAGKGRSVVIPVLVWTLKILAPMLLLLAAAAGILYVRLLNGPISLKAFASNIESAVAAELPQFRVGVEDAYVLLTERNGIEFRISNLRFSDHAGRSVAIAPQAALSLSGRAMLRGQIAPDRIVLIEPRLRLHYGRDGGIGLTFPDETGEQAGVEGLRRSFDDATAAGQAARMDLGRLLSDARDSLNQGGQVTSYLRGIGLRNATLLLDHGGRRSSWLVQNADFGVRDGADNRALAGRAEVVSRQGVWTVSFVGEDDKANDMLALRMELNRFVPNSIGPLLPQLGPFAMLSTPVSGHIHLGISKGGAVQSGSAELLLETGALEIPDAPAVAIDGGSVRVVYAGQGGGVRLEAVTLRMGRDEVKLGGEAWPVEAAVGGAWRFRLQLTEGRFAAPEFGVGDIPIDAFEFAGLVEKQGGSVVIERLRLGAGGGEISANGRMTFAADGVAQEFSGSVKSFNARTLKAFWPRGLNPTSRKWVGEQVLEGVVKLGTFSYRTGALAAAAKPAAPGSEPARYALSAVLEAEQVRFEPEPDAAPVVAPRVLIRVENDTFEMVLPEGQVVVPSGGRLELRQGRLVSQNMWDPRDVGALTYKLSGSIEHALELLGQEQSERDPTIAQIKASAKGRFAGSFNIALPLGSDVSPDDRKVVGEGKITDGEVRGLMGRYNVQGGTLDFSIGERNTEAHGKLLVSGVPVALSWQRIHGAEGHEQPPVRLSAKLDDADRGQLGIDMGGLVRGETAVEIEVSPRAGAPAETLVKVDLSKAELLLKSLAWRKAPGRDAVASFRVAPDGKDNYQLRDFKVRGPDVALAGDVSVNAKRGVYAFSFPEFALDLVSQLEISGRLSSKNVWNVAVKGRSFDGRGFYRSLFSVGALEGVQGTTAKDFDIDLGGEIGNVLGFDNVGMRNVTLKLSRRNGLIQSASARGIVDRSGGGAGQPVDISVGVRGEQRRQLLANSNDAGQVFRMVGFYPNMQGGQMELQVNLDGSGDAEKTGQLFVRDFRVYGDEIVSEVLQAPDESGRKNKTRVVREVLDFDWMRVPFSVGHGQFVVHGADLRGAVLGVTLRGKADYRTRMVSLGGTYVPLQGLNAIFKDVPLLGQILSGPNGEGVLGVTFAIQGAMDSPQVLVNPLSMVAPGIFREMFQMTNPAPRVTPSEAGRGAGGQGKGRTLQPRSSATPAFKHGGAGGTGPRIDAEGGWVSQPRRQD